MTSGTGYLTSLIAVPDDAVGELVEVRLVSKLPKRRGAASNSMRFQVYGDEPPEVVANYLAAALNG
jgi:hypothetical protein